MKTISKTDQQRLDELQTAIQQAEKDMELAVADVNDNLATLRDCLHDAHQRLADAVGEAQAFMQDVASEISGYMDDRSDKWREGDKGVAYQEWLDGWEETLPVPVEPELLDVEWDGEGWADMLGSLEPEPNA